VGEESGFCPGCRERDACIAALEACDRERERQISDLVEAVRDLKVRLGRNSMRVCIRMAKWRSRRDSMRATFLNQTGAMGRSDMHAPTLSVRVHLAMDDQEVLGGLVHMGRCAL